MNKQEKLKALSEELNQTELDRINGTQGLTVEELNVELDKIIANIALHDKTDIV